MRSKLEFVPVFLLLAASNFQAFPLILMRELIQLHSKPSYLLAVLSVSQFWNVMMKLVHRRNILKR